MVPFFDENADDHILWLFKWHFYNAFDDISNGNYTFNENF